MRNKPLHILFLLLALFALGVIGHDFVRGHMTDNLLKPNKCPLCSAYQSTELGGTLVFAFLCIFLPLAFGCFLSDQWRPSLPLHIHIFSLRAPPR